MQRFTIPRTGDAPVVFEGEHLAEVSTRLAAGRERNRWFEVDLYRTQAGKYVLAIDFHTMWQGEHDTSRVVLCDSPADVRAELTLFNPLEDVGGYPPGDVYAEKQSRLERALFLDWQTAVEELFVGLEEEFAEVIP